MIKYEEREKMIVRKKIHKIKFGLFSPEMIRKLSAAKIFTPNTYDEDGYPVEGGLMDPRLGVIDPGIRCKTCGGRLGECQGHFGHIELTRPVIHVGYAKEIYRLLRTTCRACSRILISDDGKKKFEREGGGINVEALLSKAEKVTDSEGKCPRCEEKQIKIKFVRPYSYYEGESSLLVTDIRERFAKITSEDLDLLDMKIRPEWMILSCIPVLPIIARPSITLESADRSEDDLTHKLVDILRINQRLEENINSGAPQLIIEDLWDLLQYHIATYFDNGITGIPPARHRSGRPLKTIAQRLKGKEGRFRNNLSGKRVNFSARTVIGPDPNISINEVAVPYLIATELTIPEEVNKRNIKQLKKLILNGPNKHPGAHNVITARGRKRIMDENKKEIAKNLQEGDIVERMIMDGDQVIFNRQPSLHRISMMCHSVKVLPYNTFRLNTAVCAPYNADFDGDEMNLHVPQTEEAIAEAEVLMKVQECILSPRFGKPIIGGRHDHVTGMYLLTREGSEFSRGEALNLVRNLVELPKGKKISGKEIFSLLLPKTFSITYKGKLCKKCEGCKKEKCEDEAYVKIKNGKLIAGVIDSEGLSGKLLNELIIRCGSDTAKEFIDRTTRLAIRVLMRFGFSIGIDEEDLPEKARKKIENIISKRENEVNKLIDKYRADKLKPIPGKSREESLEDYIMLELSKARNEAGKVAEEFVGKNSSSVIMAKAGARGSLLNLTQMAGTVGQQAVRGKRIKRGYFARTLSHFKKGDVSAEANGFVASSFKTGLSLTEYFFHAMGGRESLVDTAIRTGRSGYMQRRLINALQDLKVHPDLTVRSGSGTIVQFKYGEDGIDPMKKGFLKTKAEAIVS
jgi:DNA-directed RNA polymerase subunit A'